MFPCIGAEDIPVLTAYNNLTKNEKKEITQISRSITEALESDATEIVLMTNEELLTYVFDDRDPYLQSSFDHIIREIEEETACEKVQYPSYETQGTLATEGILRFLKLRGYTLQLQQLVNSRTDKCPDHYYFWPTVWNMENPTMKKLARTQLLTIRWNQN